MKTMRILGLAIAVAAALLLLSTPHASAQPVAGAYYAGEITGCDDPPCGTVDFTVSEDGLLVEEFKAYDVDGIDCQYVGPQAYPFDLEIVDDSFGPGPLDWYQVSGSFLSETGAQGTLRLAMGDPLCDTGVLDWTATVSAAVGGIAELPDVSDSSAAGYLAPAVLAAAALVALTTGGWYATRRRLR
jgi:hypothetical protein